VWDVLGEVLREKKTNGSTPLAGGRYQEKKREAVKGEKENQGFCKRGKTNAKGNE